MAAKNTIIKDDNFYKRVINRSQGRFLEDLDTAPLLDLFIEKEFLKYTDVRDIQELNLTSEKTREILKKVGSRGPRGYYIFKQLLKKTHQEHLADYLDRQEAALEKILMAEKKTHDQGIPVKMEQSPIADTHAYAVEGMERIPDDKELIRISSHIGMNWEMLGPFLRVPSTTVDQIKLDNSTTEMRVYRLFYVWRGMKGSEATFKNLLLDLRKAPKSVNIDWRKLERTIQEFDQRERQTDDLPKVSLPKVRGYPSKNPSTPGYVLNPSLEAMLGELGRTRKTGELQSNEFGPDLSGKSYPVEKEPVYGGQEGSKTDKGILPPSYKSFQYGHPDDYQVYHVHESDLKKNQGHDTGGTDSDEDKSRDRDSSENIPGLPNPLPVGTQPESCASNIVEGATGGSDFPAGGNKRGLKDDEAGRDGKRNKAADEIDAGRNRDVEKEIAKDLSGPLAGMTISGRPGSDRSSNAATFVPPIGNANVSNGKQRASGPVNATSNEDEEKVLIKNLASGIDKLQRMKMQKDGFDILDAGPGGLPNPTFIRESEGEQVVGSATQEGRNLNNRDSIEKLSKERYDRVKRIFESEDEIKGRLKVLSEENVKDLLGLCDPDPVDQGGFGEIFVSKKEVPGINMKLVLKKIECEGRSAEQREQAARKLKSLTSEKLCARAMHFGIVPLFGLQEDAISKKYYFLHPYMEKGSLYNAIQKDNTLKKGEQDLVLHAFHRLRIMYQIASAIDFLHTPIYPDVRGTILHLDITSLNIVLDNLLNARLIDFGLAHEMKHGKYETTVSSVQGVPGYIGKSTKYNILERRNDYIAFGTVMRELLTGLKPTGNGPPLKDELKSCKEPLLKKLLMSIWKPSDKTSPLAKVVISLVSLSTSCITDRKMTSKVLVNDLKTYLTDTHTPRWIRKTDKRENDQITERADPNVCMVLEKCDICLTYDAVEDSLLKHNDCDNNINVCVSCMRNSYCNPIRCHSCDTVVTPPIGHNWAALLIAGYDKRKCFVENFIKDVDEINKVITSKCPLVMGVSTKHIQTVRPETKERPHDMFEELDKSVTALQGIEGIQTLLVYYSGHYKRNEGGFELVHSKQEGTCIKHEEKYLSKEEFEKMISKILERSEAAIGYKRAIVFLDCCAAPPITPPKEQKNMPNSSGDSNQEEKLSPFKLADNIIIVQINACRQDEGTTIQPGGSIFRQFLVQCLTGKALDRTCLNSNCHNCIIEGDFVTVYKMLDYLDDHLKKYPSFDQGTPVMYAHNVSKLDAKIAYVVNCKVDLRFTLKMDNKKTEYVDVSQRTFTELRELQVLLFGAFVEKMKLDEGIKDGLQLDHAEFNGIICIEVDKGPDPDRRESLETLDKVMTAWNAKRELLVTLRRLSDIYTGMVGIFLQPNQNVKSVIEYLKKSEFVKMTSKEYATLFTVESWDDFEELMTDLENEDKSSEMEVFDLQLAEIHNAHENKEHVRELHITFPCKTNDSGQKIHRSDFFCYQLKGEEDLI